MTDIITEKFSGPLGLLLSMIEKEEMDITEINLAKIADDYVNYIKQAQDISPDELADFLLVAAKLLYIKSKALLPYLVTDDEEDDSSDLERQLKMYKEFIDASENIKNIIAEEKFLYLPPLAKSRKVNDDTPSFVPPTKINTEVLATKMKELISNLKKELEKRLPEESLPPKMNIEEKIYLIRDMLLNKVKFSLTKILHEAKDKTEIIVSFLAVLELAKQKELIFEQSELFSEIHINKHNQEEV